VPGQRSQQCLNPGSGSTEARVDGEREGLGRVQTEKAFRFWSEGLRGPVRRLNPNPGPDDQVSAELGPHASGPRFEPISIRLIYQLVVPTVML